MNESVAMMEMTCFYPLDEKCGVISMSAYSDLVYEKEWNDIVYNYHREEYRGRSEAKN